MAQWPLALTSVPWKMRPLPPPRLPPPPRPPSPPPLVAAPAPQAHPPHQSPDVTGRRWPRLPTSCSRPCAAPSRTLVAPVPGRQACRTGGFWRCHTHGRRTHENAAVLTAMPAHSLAGNPACLVALCQRAGSYTLLGPANPPLVHFHAHAPIQHTPTCPYSALQIQQPCIHRECPSWSPQLDFIIRRPPARQPAGSPTASPTPPAGAIWRRAARCARWEAGSPAAPWLTPTACMQGNVAQRPPLLSCSHQSLLGG